VRGEGAYLRDKNGVRFMLDEDSAPNWPARRRGSVHFSLHGAHTTIRMSTSTCRIWIPLGAAAFSGDCQVCQGFGLDINRDLIPVRPGAHYMVGGVTLTSKAGRRSATLGCRRSDFKRTAWRNRLAPQLARGLVFGVVRRGAAEAAGKMPDTFTIPPLSFRIEFPSQEALDVADVTNALRSLMVRKMGIVRDRAGLQEANAP